MTWEESCGSYWPEERSDMYIGIGTVLVVLLILLLIGVLR